MEIMKIEPDPFLGVEISYIKNITFENLVDDK